MMRILCRAAIAVLLAAVLALPAWAHFQVLLPACDVVGPQDGRTLDLEILFTHPMEQGPVMEMGPPKQFGVLAAGAKKDLLASLEARKLDGKTAYTATVKLSRPGDHVFYLEPAPYYEPAERKMIIHYTKVVVDFLGGQRAWDQMVGFPVEIEPLVRPFGLWTGNTFRGIVRRNGEPVPFAEIEVEYYNADGQVSPPNEAFVTQMIKADAGGVFSYTMPRAGWWGFAALVDGDEKVQSPAGEMVDVELGGLMWVKTVDME
jgi:cobalt/nickel transport protein